MMVDASAIVSILARRPGSDALLARLDAHGGPFLATPVTAAGVELVKKVWVEDVLDDEG